MKVEHSFARIQRKTQVAMCACVRGSYMLWRKDSYVLYAGQQGDGSTFNCLACQQSKNRNWMFLLWIKHIINIYWSWEMLDSSLVHVQPCMVRLITTILWWFFHSWDAWMKNKQTLNILGVSISCRCKLEDRNTYHWCFGKGKLLTLVISVWGTDITREMCLGGTHITVTPFLTAKMGTVKRL